MKTRMMTVIGIIAVMIGAVSGEAQSRTAEQRRQRRGDWEADQRMEDLRNPVGAALRKQVVEQHFKNSEEIQKRRNAYVQTQLSAMRTNAAAAAVRRQQYAEEQREKRAQAALENAPKRGAWLAARAARKAEAAKLP